MAAPMSAHLFDTESTPGQGAPQPSHDVHRPGSHATDIHQLLRASGHAIAANLRSMVRLSNACYVKVDITPGNLMQKGLALHAHVYAPRVGHAPPAAPAQLPTTVVMIAASSSATSTALLRLALFLPTEQPRSFGAGRATSSIHILVDC